MTSIPAFLLLGLLALCLLGAGGLSSSSPAAVRLGCRFLAIGSLFAVACFCARACLENYDGSQIFDRLRWQMEYAALGVGSLFGACTVVLRSQRIPAALPVAVSHRYRTTQRSIRSRPSRSGTRSGEVRAAAR